jgi:hypothetical protein
VIGGKKNELCVSPKTIEAWEANRNQPEVPARRLMSILQADPQLVLSMNIIRIGLIKGF